MDDRIRHPIDLINITIAGILYVNMFFSSFKDVLVLKNQTASSQHNLFAFRAISYFV